jgi:hypothetical protein
VPERSGPVRPSQRVGSNRTLALARAPVASTSRRMKLMIDGTP